MSNLACTRGVSKDADDKHSRVEGRTVVVVVVVVALWGGGSDSCYIISG